MKIVINARLLNERKGGPYRYQVNILNELALIDKENTYILIVNEKISDKFGFLNNPNFKQIVLPFKNRVLFDYICLPLFSYFNKADIFFFPKTTFAPYIRGKKISLYNDIIYFEKFDYREFKFFDNLHHKLMIPICAKFSIADIAISNSTSDRMKALLKIKDEKIHMIYDGVEDSFHKINDKQLLADVVSRYNLKSPFLFFAGSLSPRKNIINIIKSFELVKDRIPHNLYFTAGESWNDSDVFRYINEHNLGSRIIKLGFLPEEELVVLYNLADCYLYPSLYEGFGLPILEAQACGCPVITSDRTSCPEVAGEGAVIVNPDSVEELSQGILKIVSDRNFRKELINRGFENIKRFSWKKAAREHIELFNSIVSMK